MENPLEQYVDIPEHINYAETLINRYHWDDATARRLNAQLRRIRRKQNDRCLNLSVIGEFSTGKSSFINALLGENLLVSSVIQGTTVVNTIIEYYKQPALEIRKRSGERSMILCDSISQLSDRLSAVTTNPDTARDISFVAVGLPNSMLAKGLRIIDTPGTNSAESWHEDITREALHNLSDLSVILTDALHPAAQSLLNFVEENLSGLYNQCAFVVTYYDKIKPEERSGMMRYIEKKLSKELDIDNPGVFPYIAPAILASMKGETVMPDQQQMCAISRDSHNRLMEALWKNRQISQIKKLLSLTSEIYTVLGQSIGEEKKKYDTQYRLLLKTKQTPLEPFVEAEKEARCRDFGYKANEIRDKLSREIDRRICEAKDKIRSFITNSHAVTAEDIRHLIKEHVPAKCQQNTVYIRETYDESMKQLFCAFNATMARYFRNFENQFDKLGILRVETGEIVTAIKDQAEVSSSNLKESIDYMSTEVTRENWTIGGGGIAGAAIGTAILPGIGTVIGGFLGLVFGSRATPSPEELKRQAVNRLESPLAAYFNTVEANIMSAFDDNVNAYKPAINKEIYKYLQNYKSTVDRKIAQHNSLIEKNQSETMRISNDLRNITLRQNQLESISKQLEVV